ncbi:hypothetical protein PC129_g14354 [Phytophthora cactorum]|uniref:Uncharacterized protein n=1 Tax=Phytophthora cactorum TaxID=29920 RepID=A0A8T1HS98_9STRA|nr:hypothetical protein Pcac1_g938 [Phytophthora cactorum]KAG2885846.1 hypothetical protein PC114_g19516 [Phytophthora cactorum]KAG2907455.1 hypothetical protein PC117_g20219 [Phytophthora cactorum]KAG2986587.1 hypothetical protein PC119_g19870 [Phytophthora cactorum]KAG3004969.1 hypothetical protein PC120_g18265 [Phytophthora cactorum]
MCAAALIIWDEEHSARLDATGIEYLASLSSYPEASLAVLRQLSAASGWHRPPGRFGIDDRRQLGSLS